MKAFLTQLRTAIILTVLLSLLTGLLYPLLMTAAAQFFFPWAANGSLVERDGKAVGSLWIGQSFTDPKYFWGRPSMTSPFPYHGNASGGSNQGSSNPILLTTIQQRITHLKTSNPLTHKLVPVDLVTASGSGLDPDISPNAARYQVPRIAKERQLTDAELQALITSLLQERTLGIFGEQRLNVLQLNLALDSLGKQRGHSTSKP